MKKCIMVLCAAAFLMCAVGCSSNAVKIRSVKELAGAKIGVQRGTTGDIYASDAFGEAHIERFTKGLDAVTALRQGKVDAVIIDDLPAVAFVAENTDIILLDEPFEDEEYAVCVSKDNPELTAGMNAAIQALKADETLQRLMDYHIGGVPGSQPYTSPSGADHAKGVLKMATHADFPPYEYRDGSQIAGLDVDFARAICDRMGYALDVIDMDFDVIIDAVQSGEADFGMAAMTVTGDRLKNIDFTEPYCTARQVVLVRK